MERLKRVARGRYEIGGLAIIHTGRRCWTVFWGEAEWQSADNELYSFPTLREAVEEAGRELALARRLADDPRR